MKNFLAKNKKQKMSQLATIILLSGAILALLFPVLPEIQYFLQEEFGLFGANQDVENPIILATPHYVLIGTQEEKEAGLINSVPGFDALEDVNFGADPIVALDYKHLVIPSIGVDMPISATGKVYNEADAYAALEKGAWLYTSTSTPEAGSNTVLAGHRFKYRPPHTNTLFSLDKVKVGDEILVYWEGREYIYRINESKVIQPTDLSVLNPTETSTLTLITCHPVWSTKTRLIVTADLVGIR